MEPAQDISSHRRARRGWRRTTGVMVCVLVFIGALAGAAFWAKGRTFESPDWVRAQAADRIAAAFPDVRIAFGQIELFIAENWHPRVSVRDVQVTTPSGQEIVTVSSARASFGVEDLMQGQFALTGLDVSGVLLMLRRDEQGALEVTAGTPAPRETPAARRAAPNLATLISDFDELLLRPGLRSLENATVDALTVRYEDARARRAWTVDGARVALRRDAAELDLSINLSVLGGGTNVATVTASYIGEIGSKASDFGVTIRDLAAADIASQNPAFAWLQAIDAPISGALRGGLTETGEALPLNATLQIGSGVIQPTPESRPVPIKGAQSYFTFLPDENLLRFSELSVESAFGRGRLEGEAHLAGSGGFDGLIGQFRLTSMELTPGDLFETPISLDEAEMDFRLSLRPFALEVGRLDVVDEGQPLRLEGKVGAGSDGWTIAVDAQMAQLSTQRLLTLWPQAAAFKTRRWLSENIFAGSINDINAAFRFRPNQKRPDVYLGFDFAGVDARFLKTMPQIRNATGHANLAGNRFALVVDSGGVDAPEGGFIDITGSSFIVPDVEAKDETPGVLRLQTRSSVTAALSMLDQAPLEIMQKADLPVALAEGRAVLNGTLSLPLVKDVPVEMITFDVDGVLEEVESTVLVPDRSLEAAEIRVVVNEELAQVSGAGTLEGVAFDVQWAQQLGEDTPDSSRITGTAVLSQAALEAFRVELPPGTIVGEAQGQVDIDIAEDAPPRLSLTSDLVGAELNITPLNWRKARGTSGDFALDVSLGPVPDVERLSLSAPGLTAEGTVRLTEDGQLDRVRFNRLRVRDWLDAPVDLVGRGGDLSPGIVIRGGRFDLRTADLGEGADTGERVPLNVTLDRLQLTDEISLNGLTGQFTVGGGIRGQFAGSINGQAPIAGEIAPQNGRSAVRVIADDAGRIVAAAGALRQARGGALELLLEPVGSGGAFDGRLRVTDLRIIEAPAIAALLNAISIVGLVNELSGDGIFFSEVLADFRLTANRITLRRASAEGASMGLSMDGVYQTDTGRLQLQGVISPVYLINRIGTAFTRAGEGLFGFNYAITGTVDNPQVSVNALSALAPGGMRDLFRAPRTVAPLVDGETPPPPVEPRAPPVVNEWDER
ncbi:MAG: DUF3971 domain-containing protein [Roseobacter sp.]